MTRLSGPPAIVSSAIDTQKRVVELEAEVEYYLLQDKLLLDMDPTCDERMGVLWNLMSADAQSTAIKRTTKLAMLQLKLAQSSAPAEEAWKIKHYGS